MLLATVARVDFIFCKVITYYADVTNHINQLEAKVERMTFKAVFNDDRKIKLTKTNKLDLSINK